MEALINACARDDYPARIGVVISNRPDAAGLEKASAAGLKTAIVDHKMYQGREAFERALNDEIINHAPIDLICLAGFMRLLTPWFVGQWYDRLMNIHPSLLPDYKGLDTHARALADGRTEAGCTVHFVRPEMDEGPIIVQKRVPVQPGDTPDTLAARVLSQEHLAYTEAVELVARKLQQES